VIRRRSAQGGRGGPVWEDTIDRYNGLGAATTGRPRQRRSPRLRAAGIARSAPTGVNGGERRAHRTTEHVAGPGDRWMVRGQAQRRDLSRDRIAAHGAVLACGLACVAGGGLWDGQRHSVSFSGDAIRGHSSVAAQASSLGLRRARP
jgi:hypothetical protein